MEITPFDKREGYIWYNGKIIPWQEGTIHILNHGLTYASCVWEGIRVYNSKIFKLEPHITRFHQSAKLLDFIIPYSEEKLNQATKEIVKAHNIIDGYIRPMAWRGSERITCSAPNNSIHVAITCWVMANYYKDREFGLKLNIAKWRRPSPDTAPTASKAAGLYMISTMSKHEAERQGYDDALMLDYRGYIAEATVANFFMVINGELHTPIPDCFLNGITRLTIMELAKKRNFKVVERYIKPEELSLASEIFLTGTAAEITPVVQINEYKYNIGEITKTLSNDYKSLISSQMT